MNSSPTVGVGRLLNEGVRYIVPQHQRDYSWTEDQIEQLFDDILSAIDEQCKEYFFGLMVFIPYKEAQKESYSILDGQQRLVTTTIIYSSIRTWLTQHGEIEESTLIQNQFIGSREFGEKETLPILQLNTNNHQVFSDFVVGERPLSEISKVLEKVSKYDANYDLLKAIVFCKEKIEKLAQNTFPVVENAKKYFIEIVKYIRDNLKVVRLLVPDEANAYTVFETLNARGLELSAFDLVKNYLFGKAKHNIDVQFLQSNWFEMISNLTSNNSENFLKIFWTSKYGRIQESLLFETLKKKYSSWESVKELSIELVKISAQYENVYISNSSLWQGYNKEVKEVIDDLYIINSRQLVPIILAAINNFEKDELGKLLKVLEVFIVRYQLIQGGRTGLLEIACAKLAKKISDKVIIKASKAYKDIEELMPIDSKFIEAFKVKQEKNSKKAVFILQKIENENNKEKNAYPELVPNNSLTLEHILPKNPNQDWKKLFHDTTKNIEEYKYRIGNLCLLSDVNKTLGSKGYHSKVDEYKKSKITITKEISFYKDWNFDSIEARQNELALIAVKAWPIPSY